MMQMGDLYGLQNTMNVSTHKHLRSLPHEDGTPAGTSGWFLGSMGQWDLFIREFLK